MEIYKFIQTEKINDFESLKLKLESFPFNLKIKTPKNEIQKIIFLINFF